MDTGVLIGFYAKQDEARAALRELYRRGYRRVALVSKSADGMLHMYDPFLWRRALGIIIAALVVGGLVGVAYHILQMPESFPRASVTGVILVFISGMIGAFIAGVCIRRSKYGVERKFIADHSRTLVSEETVLILQTPIARLRFPVKILREGGEISPAIFLLHPKRDISTNGLRKAVALLSLAQIQEHAQHLATEHQIEQKPQRNTDLLKRLENARVWVHQACADLSETSRLEKSTPPIAEWILDNEYIIESNVRDVQLNLPLRFYRELPVLANEPCKGLPRVFGIAQELVSHIDLRLDQENILAFLEAYQSKSKLSIGELWAIPQMLRIALIESVQGLATRALTEMRDRELADLWANRLITVNRQDPPQLFAIMAELTKTQPRPSPYFASQLIDHLYDEEAALVPVQSWLERTYSRLLTDLNLREQNRQARDQITIGNAFTSLRYLDLLDWRKIFERLSHVEQMLRLDPAGVYPKMEFDTRNRYRQAVEELARGSNCTEDLVAQQAIQMAKQAALENLGDERRFHVGAYLIGDGRGELVRFLGCKEVPRYHLLHWLYHHHSLVYFSGISFLMAIFITLIAWLGLHALPMVGQLSIILLSLIPASQLTLDVLNYMITRLLPPRTLPRMDFKDTGIPDDFRTLVVIPDLLMEMETIRAMVEKLEIRYLANNEDNLLFSLFTDYTDSDQAHREEDDRLLQSAIAQIEALNHRYGGERFYLFHRERVWSESEQKYIGWERKRGKLEELNRLISGMQPQDAERLVYVGDPERLYNVRFVITLDSDTQLPLGTARKMIETLAHPLNQPRFDAEGRILEGSYTIIQPRVTPSLPSTSASLFSRLFSDAVGIDPYTKAVSDVNQDLTGEGSYQGKGIYDVRAFSRVLTGRFPEEWLLSHDLIEGAHVRVGLASDIELIDEFPRDYLSYTNRQHRWMRGDWQIADWLWSPVPLPDRKRGPNQLSWYNRWKIFDNLRRSLVPPASLGLLMASWLTAPQIGWISSLVVAIQFLFQPLAQPFTWATSPHGLKNFSLSKVAHDLLLAVVKAALLPHQAGLALDAILRVWYRRLISHRGLLEWTSVQVIRWSAPDRLPIFFIIMGISSILSGIVGWAVWRWMPANLAVASPWLALWFLSPLVGWLLNLRPQTKPKQLLIPDKDLLFLRQVARRTWRYFSDFVNNESAWLPPDNYQVSHQNRLAMRTSPTNIGLWLLSALSAHDFGYLTVDQVVEKLTHTMETIDKLERYEGHLLNWYEIETLTPLLPRYISSVDSGNLLGALWTLEHGLDNLIQEPVLDVNAFEGLRDTLGILNQVMVQEAIPGLDSNILDELTHTCESPPERVVDLIQLLRKEADSVKVFADQARELAVVEAGVTYWAKQIDMQVSAWLSLTDRYLHWIEILAEKPEEELSQLCPDTLLTICQCLHHAPSLHEIASGEVACIQALQLIREAAPPIADSVVEWLDRLLKAFSISKWLAGEMLGLSDRLIQDVHGLSEEINMGFLYDPERRLFSIGYNVLEDRLDNAYYDLLASEARLGSFIAIARGEAPIEHWFSMSRPYRVIDRRNVLLSWTGTMFEYLMPLLFQRSYEHSLLDKAAKDAVAIQIAYGRKRRAPWGISESAFGDLDFSKTYQYKAFGVPDLGLKRGLEQELVIAPYATLLAVNIAPRESVKNLRRLASLGLLQDFGFYEAVDFNRQSAREGERGVIVRAYMAHHQGMSFLSLNNFLHASPLQQRFRAETRVRAVELLLHERIPKVPPMHHISTRERVPSMERYGEIEPTVSKFDTPNTITPKTLLLGNGRYRLMITNAGGGFCQWGDIEITRWRSDRTRDSWGTFFYIQEADSDRLWSNTYQPICGDVEPYSAHFTLDRAVFQRTDHNIQTQTEVIVSAEDDVEIRRITLTNRSITTRRLNLTSYIELSMAQHNADRQHPAFNKLFFQTEAVPEQQAILAHRRPRTEDEPSIYLAHSITLEQISDAAMQFETDRRRFIGRGRTLANPLGAFQEPSNSQGFVLDPILSMRRSVTLNPGQRVQVSLILAAGETRQQALNLLSKYDDPHAIDRAMDFTWASAQLELRLLHLQPDEARRFQVLASHLLFPNASFRAPAERIAANSKGQAGLWPYGISGDLPIVLVTIGEERDIHLIRQMLQAQTYWRRHGLVTDLVILNEEAGGYDQPLHERLETLIQAHLTYIGAELPGGIFLRRVDQIPEDDLTLLTATASVVLVAARGPLPQQLGLTVEFPELPEALTKKRASREPSALLPFMELPYFNSLGGFTPDGREYAIYLGPDTVTPAPWVNIIANQTFGTLVSEAGSGFTWYGNSQRNRLTEWSNDPVIDPPSEVLYIRDEETGVYWTPTPSPIHEETAYRTRHGAGYTVFEHNSNGIEQELMVFIPVDENGGAPIKLQRLRLKNDTSRQRKLSVTYYLEWTLGENRETSQMHIVTTWDEDVRALIARNRYHPEYGERVAFAALDPPAESYSGDRTAFIGRNRSLTKPAGMERVRRSRRVGAGLDPCASQQVFLDLAPGETVEITCMLGQAESIEAVHKLVLAYREEMALETALNRTKAWWDDLLGTIQIQTPELAVDFLINRWLLYQSLSCRIWGRTGFYQSGGAFGFRDQLQDVLALLYSHPKLARQQILLAASRQFVEGDVQHWWHSPSGAGIRTRISDDLLWLPYVVAQYVRITGDLDILNKQVSFLEAPALQDDQLEAFVIPEVASEQAPLFEHCQRALTRGQTSGPHRLPLMGTGDWNDGMNRVGSGGKGESVWLAWFLVDVLQGMREMSDLMDRSDLSQTYEQEQKLLIQNIERAAWDGEWYLRAIFDDGTPIGSATSKEAKIDSIPQSWAVISSEIRGKRAERALDSVWQNLVHETEGLVLLFTPPFDKSQPSPGYIMGYPPGVRENGGQYTHAALWFAMALARQGDGERAEKILRLLNPIERTIDQEKAWHYRIEPYVIAADVYHSPGRIGQGGWSWYTGSAAWMYRVWIEEVLGLKVRSDRMQIDPVIPAWWQGFHLRYRHGEAVYEIQVENPEKCEQGIAWVEMDGRRLPDGVIPLARDLIKHRILVHMGNSRQIEQ